MAGGSESAARGGGSARTTGTAIGGLSGFYSGSFVRRTAEAAEQSASAGTRRAAAAETMASEISKHAQSKGPSKSGFDKQPHEDDPNQAAIDI